MKLTMPIVLVLILVLAGCAPSAPYRTEFSSLCEYHVTGDCHDQSMTIGMEGDGGEYLLSILEYDEQGMLQKPQAAENIINTYSEIASENDVLLITFIHGWHSSAQGQDDENIDLVQFRAVLSKAALEHHDKEILGIYVGWRGRSLRGYLDFLTFWGRKQIAHEVGQNGGITQALLAFDSIVRDSNNPNSKMITIGHSFGGAAVFSTLNLVLAERYSSSRQIGSDNYAEGFGDLVVLLNPAFEAIRYSALFELAQSGCNKYPTTQLPNLVILSSKNDFAVDKAFQAGQFFNAISEKHRRAVATHCVDGNKVGVELRQFQADIVGVGHYQPYITHDLCAQKSGESFSIQNGGNSIVELWSDNLQSGSVSFGKTVLTSRNITDSFNPYMNIYTDGDVCDVENNGSLMNGHTDIWTDEVLNFLNEIINVSVY